MKQLTKQQKLNAIQDIQYQLKTALLEGRTVFMCIAFRDYLERHEFEIRHNTRVHSGYVTDYFQELEEEVLNHQAILLSNLKSINKYTSLGMPFKYPNNTSSSIQCNDRLDVLKRVYTRVKELSDE